MQQSLCKISAYRMFRATHLPAFSILLDDQFTRDHAKVAKQVGVTIRTLQRYIALDDAPRAVLLALFYESRWGVSLIHSSAHNDAIMSAQLAASLGRENASLRARIAYVEGLAAKKAATDQDDHENGFGSANEPFFKTL